MLQGPLRLLLLPMNALLLLLNRRELHPSEIYSLSVRAASCCRYHTRHNAAAASSSVVFNVCPRVCRQATVSFTRCYQVLQEKDAMVVRSADELVAVKSQAKAAGLKFSERAKAEKLALQAEIKQLQVTPMSPRSFGHLPMHFLLQETLAARDEELRTALGARVAEGSEAARAQVSLIHF
jgi:hypothetical protein